MEKYARFVVLTAASIFAGAFGVYLFVFGSSWNFGNQEQFGQFGDFMGGIINPSLSFLTIVLLLRSLSMQSRELKQSIDTLEKTLKIHEKQTQLLESEAQRKQLEEFVTTNLETFARLLNAKEHKAPEKGENTLYSIRQILTAYILDASRLEHRGLQMHGPEADEYPALFDMIHSLESATHAALRMLKLLDDEVLCEAWQARLDHWLGEAGSLMIGGPYHFNRLRSDFIAKCALEIKRCREATENKTKTANAANLKNRNHL